MIRIDTEKMYDNEYAETGESERTTNFLMELVSIGVEFQTEIDDKYIYIYEIAEQYNEDEAQCLLDVLADDGYLYLTDEELERSKHGISSLEEHFGLSMEYAKIK